MPKSMFEMASSPETLIMLPFAICVDLIGIGLVVFGLDDFWITDIIALTFIGSWSYFRSQIITPTDQEPVQIKMPALGEKKKVAEKIRETQRLISQETQKAQKTARAAKWAKWGKRLKWLEFIPYIGAFPFWTVSVYLTIKHSD